jgi:5'-nucleotidase
MTHRPILLLSNDDGWQSPGIEILADVLESIGEVWVVAPERERSAVSHAISLHKPLRVEEHAPRRFWCSGSPADSVYIAVNHVLPHPPDIVVSGINNGANLGDDVIYSGTVAAAREGALMGHRALAVSLAERGDEHDFALAAAVARQVAQELLHQTLPHRTLLNLNIPRRYDPALGYQRTYLGRRNYGRVVQKSHDPRGRPYYWIGGPAIGFDHMPGSDCNAVDEGRASLSLVSTDFRAVADGWPYQA